MLFQSLLGPKIQNITDRRFNADAEAWQSQVGVKQLLCLASINLVSLHKAALTLSL